MTDAIRTKIEALLDEIYTEAEKAIWWKSGQPLFDGRKPDALIADGKGQDVIDRLQALLEGVYI